MYWLVSQSSLLTSLLMECGCSWTISSVAAGAGAGTGTGPSAVGQVQVQVLLLYLLQFLLSLHLPCFLPFFLQNTELDTEAAKTTVTWTGDGWKRGRGPR